MHPKLAPILNRYHADDLMVTVLRSEERGDGWLMSRGDQLLTYDGWYSPGIRVGGDFPPLLEGDVEDIEDLRAANRRNFGALSTFWLFADGDLAPGMLADRVLDIGWGRYGEDWAHQRGALLSADPVAFLSLGNTEGLKRLAEVAP